MTTPPRSPPSAARRSKKSRGDHGRDECKEDQVTLVRSRSAPSRHIAPACAGSACAGSARPWSSRIRPPPAGGQRGVLPGEVRGMILRLNDIKPAPGSNREHKRVGRASAAMEDRGTRAQGPESPLGGYHKVGFEGGQMPLQRRRCRSVASIAQEEPRPRGAAVDLRRCGRAIDSPPQAAGWCRSRRCAPRSSSRARSAQGGAEGPARSKGRAAPAIEGAGGSVERAFACATGCRAEGKGDARRQSRRASGRRSSKGLKSWAATNSLLGMGKMAT